MLSFRLWVDDLFLTEVDAEKYDRDYKHKAERAAQARKEYFAQFFPTGKERIAIRPKNIQYPSYIHAEVDPNIMSSEDRQVINLLKQYGYNVTDYQGGYVQRGKGVEKIGKVFEKLIRNAQNESERNKLQVAFNRFSQSPARRFASAQNLWIIISRNAHDIAQMSFTRNWQSCMDLDGGMYCQTPYSVIKSGGMVAYLVNAPQNRIQQLLNDTSTYIDSKEAIARVSIKASTDKSGKVIASLEERVYPHNIKGFWESVYDWLEERQSTAEGGRYKVKGGYSDTYSGEHTFAPRDHRGLWEYLNSRRENRHKAALYHILNSREDFPPPIWEKVKEILLSAVEHEHEPENLSEYGKILSYLVRNKPDIFTQEDMTKLPYQVKHRLNRLGKGDTRIRDALINSINYGLTHGRGDYVKPLEDREYNSLTETLDAIVNGEEKLADDRTLNYITNWLRKASSMAERMLDLQKVNNPKEQEFLNRYGKEVAIQSKELIKKLMAVCLKLEKEHFIERNHRLPVFIGEIYVRMARFYPDMHNLELLEQGLERLKRIGLIDKSYYLQSLSVELYRSWLDAFRNQRVEVANKIREIILKYYSHNVEASKLSSRPMT